MYAAKRKYLASTTTTENVILTGTIEKAFGVVCQLNLKCKV